MKTTHPLSRRLILQAGAASAVLGAPGMLLAQPKPAPRLHRARGSRRPAQRAIEPAGLGSRDEDSR